MRRMILLLLVGALIATACGGTSNDASSSDGEGSLIAAVLKLQGSPSTMTLTLQSDVASLRALTAADGGDSLGGTDFNTVLNSSITVSRTGAAGAKDARSQTVIKIGDNDHAIETRMVDQKLYVRADIPGLINTFGKDRTDLSDLVKEADAYHFDFVRPAVQGKWLSLDGLDKVSKTLASATGTSMPSDNKNKQLSDEFLQRLLSRLTVRTVGDDSAGTHMEASIPAREAYAALQQLVLNAGKGLPSGAAMPSPTTIPNKPITVDVWVRDGKLTQIELDLKRLSGLGDKPLPSGVHQLAIRIAISDFTGTIEAPSGAVPVDLNKLTKNFMGLKGTKSSGTGSASAAGSAAMPQVNCDQLQAMPSQDLRSLLNHNPAAKKMLEKHCPSLNLEA
jgi:hypothetical protein